MKLIENGNEISLVGETMAEVRLLIFTKNNWDREMAMAKEAKKVVEKIDRRHTLNVWKGKHKKACKVCGKEFVHIGRHMPVHKKSTFEDFAKPQV